MFRTLAILSVAGCAGRWMAVNDLESRQLPGRFPQDYRAVLRNDSVVVLHRAFLRNDSLVETSSEQAVALDEIQELELWQSRGERITGGVVLGIVAGLVAAIWVIARAVGGPGS